MEKLIGTLAATAIQQADANKQLMIEEINRAIKPPKPVTIETVHLGVLQAASDRVNLQGGCFETSDLEKLAELIVDAPVMVGHDKQGLPIGRVFKGEVVSENGTPWLRAYFYWHRDQRNADALKANIDAGIYKECSLGFLYGKPECGVCRQDMRLCRHRVNEAIRLGDREIKAFFYYKQIEKILEVSLVYRGAVEGTRVTALGARATDNNVTQTNPFWRQSAEVVFDLAGIKQPLDKIMIEPLYRGVWLAITCAKGEITATTPDGQAYYNPVINELKSCSVSDDYSIIAQLIPFKGGSRLPLRSLAESHARRTSPRCRLAIVDIVSLDGVDLSNERATLRKEKLSQNFRRTAIVTLIPHYCCRFVELSGKAFAEGTAEGLRVIVLDEETEERGFEIRRKQLVRGKVKSVAVPDGGRSCRLVFEDDVKHITQSHPFNARGYDLVDGTLVWAGAARSSSPKFTFVDICIGDNVTDDPATLERLTPSDDHGSFYQYLDESGDCWIELRHQRRRALLHIARLNLPLLERGRKFWCCFGNDANKRATRVKLVDRGEVLDFCDSDHRRTSLSLVGKTLRGRYIIEEARFGAEQRQLFFKEGV